MSFVAWLYIYQGLTIDDLEDLLVDIKVYMELEEGKNATFWKVSILWTVKCAFLFVNGNDCKTKRNFKLRS